MFEYSLFEYFYVFKKFAVLELVELCYSGSMSEYSLFENTSYKYQIRSWFWLIVFFSEHILIKHILVEHILVKHISVKHILVKGIDVKHS